MMNWIGKPKDQTPIDSMGVQLQPILFYPERNEYELRIELPDCPKDLIKVTFDRPSRKLKVQGEKHYKRKFVQEVTVPEDCVVNEIYGRFQGDVLHIIMPRTKIDLPAKNAFEKQEDQRVSPDRELTETERGREKIEKDRELPAKDPAPETPDQKTTEKVREREEKNQEELPATIPPPPKSDQETIEKVRERIERYQKLLADIAAPSPSDQKTTEKVRERVIKDSGLTAKVSAQPPSDQKTNEKIGDKLEKDQVLTAKVPASPPSDKKNAEKINERVEKGKVVPAKSLATPPSNQKTADKLKEKVEDDQESPAKFPASQPSDQKTAEQKAVGADSNAHQKVIKEDKNSPEIAEEHKKEGRKCLKSNEPKLKPDSVARVSKKKKPDAEVDDEVETGERIEEEENKDEKPSSGNEKGLIATMKEKGKAALTAAMKEENRRALILGASILAFWIIGTASVRMGKKFQH